MLHTPVSCGLGLIARISTLSCFLIHSGGRETQNAVHNRPFPPKAHPRAPVVPPFFWAGLTGPYYVAPDETKRTETKRTDEAFALKEQTLKRRIRHVPSLSRSRTNLPGSRGPEKESDSLSTDGEEETGFPLESLGGGRCSCVFECFRHFSYWSTGSSTKIAQLTCEQIPDELDIVQRFNSQGPVSPFLFCPPFWPVPHRGPPPHRALHAGGTEVAPGGSLSYSPPGGAKELGFGGQIFNIARQLHPW